MGITEIISQSEASRVPVGTRCYQNVNESKHKVEKWVIVYRPIFLGNTFCGNHTELAMGIVEIESEADLYSDKIFFEFHFIWL